MRILIVDDDKYILEVISRMLNPEGFETKLCSSVEEAIDVLAEESFEMVITDLFMPEMQKDGTELAQYMKRHDPSVPVLAITGDSDDGADAYVQYAGKVADEIMFKPLEKTKLLEMVVKYLQIDLSLR